MSRVLVLAAVVLIASLGCSQSDRDSGLRDGGSPAGTASVATPAVARAPDELLRSVSATTPLPPDFVPGLVELAPDLRSPTGGQLLLIPDAAEGVQALMSAASSAGIELRLAGAFLSFADQERLANAEASAVTEARPPGSRLRPGTSDRQLGTAVLFVGASSGFALDPRFAGTVEGAWLTAHAHEFGFAVADPAIENAALSPEPSHYRFIGREEAARWRASGQPLGPYLLELPR